MKWLIALFMQGQTKTYYTNVGTGVNWLEVDLNWGNQANSLSLTIYKPSGSSIGTYYDIDDGVSVVGTEDYTFNVYQH